MPHSAASKLRIAALADIHCGRNSQGQLRSLLMHAAQDGDVLLLCGDLTDHGSSEEARVLAGELAAAADGTPILAVLGNHDFESGEQVEVTRILGEAGVQVLDGDAQEIGGVGFVGTKGFGGGFGERALEPWGEREIKSFVQAAIDESLKLEKALSRLHMAQRVVLLHYSPIEETVRGEPLEILPFLGSSRLEEPLNRYSVSAVFHGHAHRGQMDGRTQTGIPVYNVAAPLLARLRTDQLPYRIVELSLDERVVAPHSVAEAMFVDM